MPDPARDTQGTALSWANAAGRPIVSSSGHVLRVIRVMPKMVLLENPTGAQFRNHKNRLSELPWCLARSDDDIPEAMSAVNAAEREAERIRERAEIRAGQYIEAIENWCHAACLAIVQRHAPEATLFTPKDLPVSNDKAGWAELVGRYLVPLHLLPRPYFVERQTPKSITVYDEADGEIWTHRKDELRGLPPYGFPWKDRNRNREHWAVIDDAATANAAARDLDIVREAHERWRHETADSRANEYKALASLNASALQTSILEREIDGNPNLTATSLLA